jgi:two-component system, NarL family, response regulator DevR
MSPSSTGDIGVMIVDDHEVVRRGIAEVVERSEGMTVVAEAGSVGEAVRRAALVRPRVMLVDLRLPDGTGIDVLRSVAESLPDTRAVVLTSFDDDDALAAALAAGAAAYLLKSVHGAEIAQVIRSVAAGRTLLDERTITRRQAGHDDPAADLTPSERKVVELIGDGMSNREIAERLGVSEKTVKNHVTAVLAKMGLQRRTQVTAWIAGRRASAWRGDTA